MVAAVTATPDAVNGYIALALSGLGAATTVNLVRIDLFGNPVAVRNGDPLAVSGGIATASDYEVPTDNPVTYEVRDTGTGLAVATSSSATLASNGLVWLGHPGKPALNRTFTVKDLTPGVRAARSGTYPIIGKRLPVVRTMRRSGPAGNLVLRVDTAAQWTALNDLADDGYPLLLRLPTGWIFSAAYLALGDITPEQPSGIATDQLMNVSVPWTEVDRPAGLAQAGPGQTWADVGATYATWAAVEAANPRWLDVEDGVP